MSTKTLDDINDLGLRADLAMWTCTPLARWQILQLGLVGIGTLLAGCSTSQSQSDSSSGATTDGCVSEIPAETAGPYPGDGSNGPNALTRSGIVRRDVRPSLATGTLAEGIPLTIKLKLVNTNAACAPLAGYAIYLWHCDREGRYSMYSDGVTGEDYLRGVQETDAEGNLTFESIFPGCYSGRWPHAHFEMYPSLAAATDDSNKLHTSQLAIPKDVCDAVYATDGYSQSVTNLSRLSLTTDNIFRDGADDQLASVTGSITEGYTASLTVGLAV